MCRGPERRPATARRRRGGGRAHTPTPHRRRRIFRPGSTRPRTSLLRRLLSRTRTRARQHSRPTTTPGRDWPCPTTTPGAVPRPSTSAPRRRTLPREDQVLDHKDSTAHYSTDHTTPTAGGTQSTTPRPQQQHTVNICTTGWEVEIMTTSSLPATRRVRRKGNLRATRRGRAE